MVTIVWTNSLHIYLLLEPEQPFDNFGLTPTTTFLISEFCILGKNFGVLPFGFATALRFGVQPLPPLYYFRLRGNPHAAHMGDHFSPVFVVRVERIYFLFSLQTDLACDNLSHSFNLFLTGIRKFLRCKLWCCHGYLHRKKWSGKCSKEYPEGYPDINSTK